MAQGNATIKAVLSGDTVVLMGNATNGPPPEMTLTLASLQAPKFSRNPEVPSEPFAWQSREFLRELAVGKQVQFKVEYKVASINRQFGAVILNGENLCLTVAREGWARVKTLEQSRDGASQDLEEMLSLEQLAIQEQKGIHSANPTNANATLQFSSLDASSFCDANKDKELPAIIESVRDGASMRIILKDGLHVVNFALAGVQCPRMNTPSSNSTEPTEGPQPHALEAKYFTEIRLLNREVNVLLQGVDNYGNFFGTIVHRAGNIGVELLKNGLAKMSDWSASYVVPATRAVMRNAEREAKLKKLRLWKNYKPAVVQGEKSYIGKLIEVVSGDTVIVLVQGSNVERRLSLSSIRAPRLGNARRGEADAPYSWEAKDFLRQKGIGKSVQVSVEYERDPAAEATGPAAQKRSFGTVVVTTAKKQKKNLAEMLVAEGLAEVVRHRPEDDKSAHYDDLLVAEANAQSQKKGMHSSKKSEPHRFTDLSTDGTKAKKYFPFLKREKKLRAVVEYVYSGIRVKVFIPKENCMVNFSVAGVKCPNPSRRGPPTSNGAEAAIRPADAFGEEAKTFARERLMQRNVEIEVEDMDRGGTIFGSIVVVGNATAYGCEILKQGLAKVDEYSVDRTRMASQLQQAESEAKQAKLKVWTLVQAGNTAKAPATARTADEVMKVRLSDIVTGGHFFMNNAESGGIESMETKMKAFTAKNGTQGAPFEAKRGVICAGLFENVWNRCKIEGVDASGRCRVRFIDYGNNDVLPTTKLRPLDPALSHLPPLAIECVLGFLKVPSPAEDFGQEAGYEMNSLAWGKTLKATVFGKDDNNRLRVALTSNEGMSIGEELVRNGLARLNRKEQPLSFQKPIYDQYFAAQEAARKARTCMWQYGDVQSDDEM